MVAASLYMQEPAVRVFKDINTFMGNLPEQMVKIFLGFGRRDFLVNGYTTD